MSDRELPLPIWNGGIRQWDWQARAACRDVDMSTQHDFTYLPGGRPRRDGGETAAMRHAKRLIDEYCKGCPVLRECADWARRDYFFSGVAGGRMIVERHTTARQERSKRGRVGK